MSIAVDVFEGQVRAQIQMNPDFKSFDPDKLEQSASKIISLYRKKKDIFYQTDIGDAIKEIIEDVQPAREVFSESTPDARLSSKFILERLTPKIEEIRKKIFGSIKAPFDQDQAVNWIEEKSINSGKELKRIGEETLNEFERINEIFHKNHMALEMKRKLLPYVKEKDGPIFRVPVTCPELAALERETRRISERIGFNQEDLVMYILTGIEPPAIPRLKAEIKINTYPISNREGLKVHAVNLTINARDLTPNELNQFYRKIKRPLNLEYESSAMPRRLSAKDEKLYNLVKDTGEPPKKGESGHWESWKEIEKKWKEQTNEKPQTWQGLRKSFNKIKKKLEKRH